MEHAPKLNPFQYLLIPSDNESPVDTIHFTTGDDSTLRDNISKYFRKVAPTKGQQSEYRETVRARVEAKGTSTEAVSDDMLDSSSGFEIVPLTLPSRANGFIATSLYIDDIGRFKELPLNDRASRLAQRDIRGDAFLLSNHDDPASEEWQRVDTTMNVYEELARNPPTSGLDTSNTAAMAQAAALRDHDAVLVSEENAAQAIQLKAAGNELVAAGNFADAAAAYTKVVELTVGRTDKLQNGKAVDDTRLAAFLNRAHCALKLGQFNQAQDDCQQALRIDSRNVKALFRLGTAQCQLVEFNAADATLHTLSQVAGDTPDVQALQALIQTRRREHRDAEKKLYNKMFA